MKISNVKSVTILEILTVIIIIGILAALALPNFGRMRERALDNEAKANLKLIQAAEKIYRMETGYYYPDVSFSPVFTNDINDQLKLFVSGNNWAYKAITSVTAPLTVTAEREPPPSGWDRTFLLYEQVTAEPCCCGQQCIEGEVCTTCP